MNKDLKEVRNLSQLLKRRTETFPFMIDEIMYILDQLNRSIKDSLNNLCPVIESINLYFKIVTSTDEVIGNPHQSVDLEMTGAEAFILLLCLFQDNEDSKMRNKLFVDIYLGVLGMKVNDK